MRRKGGAWIGWHGAADEKLKPFEHDGLRLVPVQLSAQEVEEYYEGFSNATLWPLYHDVIAPPEFHREWWDSYVRVNRRFAERAARIARRGATVWVQDYQLQLVPAMLRELRPDLRIGFFLHIPFPPPRAVPAAARGAGRSSRASLGADLVGFQLPGGGAELRPAGPRAGRPQDASRPDLPARRAHRRRPGLPDLDRRAGVRGARPHARRRCPREGDPREPRQPQARAARHRPARLHQGSAPAAPRVRRDHPRRLDRRRRRRVRAGGHAVARARRPVPAPARRHRPAGRAHQRRRRPHRRSSRSPTCTRRTRARRWPRSTAPPTSWSSPRCATA